MLKRISALCAGLLFAVSVFAQNPASPPAQVLRSAAELEQYLKAGANPLDAFTPYGRRDFLRGLCWGEQDSCGLSYKAIQRELSTDQARAVARLFGAESYIQQVILSLDQSPPLRLPEPSATLEQRYLDMQVELRAMDKEVNATDNITQRHFQPVISHYLQAHATELAHLDRLSTSDLVLLFDGLTSLAGASLDEQVIAQQQNVYAQLRARQLDTRRGLDDNLLYPLMNLRMFDAIAQLQAQYPSLQSVKLPQVEDKLGKNFVGRSVYRYEPNGNRLVRAEFSFAPGKQLLMVVGEGCHFSLDAMARLSSDAGFAQLARDANLAILTPPASAAPTFMLSQWNRAHPEWQIQVASNRSEWREIDAPSVPIFYVFENGKLIHKVSGWEGEVTLNAIKKKL